MAVKSIGDNGLNATATYIYKKQIQMLHKYLNVLSTLTEIHKLLNTLEQL